MKKKTILFLLSDTGGGHRRAAQAISQAISELYPHQFEIIIEDILQQYSGWPFSQIPRAYAWSINSALPLWKLFWVFTRYAPVYKFINAGAVFMVRDSFQRYFTNVNPDIVISVHPILNHSGLSILRQVGITCPFITVVTDLTTVHPVWIYPDVTRCFVSTDIARNQAITWGMPADKVTVSGQPVSPRFIVSNTDKQRARQALGLKPGCPTVLITGGGEGDNRIFDIAQKLVCCVPQVQLMVVTGRNHYLRRRLEALTRSKRLHLYGFVDNMPKLMQATDILITKAGPGTISEALVMGLPMILYGYIPGQEEGNTAYIQKHKAGIYVEQPAAIAKLVLEWTTSRRNILSQMAQNATNLAYPLASYKIAEYIYRLVEAPQAEAEFRR